MEMARHLIDRVANISETRRFTGKYSLDDFVGLIGHVESSYAERVDVCKAAVISGKNYRARK